MQQDWVYWSDGCREGKLVGLRAATCLVVTCRVRRRERCGGWWVAVAGMIYSVLRKMLLKRLFLLRRVCVSSRPPLLSPFSSTIHPCTPLPSWFLGLHVPTLNVHAVH